MWLRILDVTIVIKQHVDPQWMRTAVSSRAQPGMCPHTDFSVCTLVHPLKKSSKASKAWE